LNIKHGCKDADSKFMHILDVTVPCDLNIFKTEIIIYSIIKERNITEI
jgi:hypothetical protein